LPTEEVAGLPLEKKVVAQIFGAGTTDVVCQRRLAARAKIEDGGHRVVWCETAGLAHLLFEFGYGAEFEKGLEEDAEKSEDLFIFQRQIVFAFSAKRNGILGFCEIAVVLLLYPEGFRHHFQRVSLIGHQPVGEQRKGAVLRLARAFGIANKTGNGKIQKKRKSNNHRDPDIKAIEFCAVFSPAQGAALAEVRERPFAITNLQPVFDCTGYVNWILNNAREVLVKD